MPGSLVSVPVDAPYIVSPSVVIGFVAPPPVAAIVIDPAAGVMLMFAPAVIVLYSKPPPVCATPRI